MSIGTAIHSLLSTDATFAGIMGSRVFPNTVPAKTVFPFTVYTIIGTTPADDKDGVSPLDEILVQVDLYSKSYDTTKSAAIRSREVLDRYRNYNYSADLSIDKIVIADEKEGDFDAEIGVYWTSQDWLIRLNRTGLPDLPFTQPIAGNAAVSVGAAIYTMMSIDPTFSAAMGTRIFPNTVPAKAALPYAVYSITGTDYTNTKDGISPLDEVLVKIDLYGKSYNQLKQSATRSRQIFDRYRNLTFSPSLAIDRVIFENEIEGDYDPELGAFWTSQNWRFRINRTQLGEIWFTQSFTGQASNTITVTVNFGVLPADDSIEMYLNGQQFTGWTKSGSIITLPFTTEVSDLVVIRFRTLADGSTAFAQTFTNVTTNSVTVTENSGTLPAAAAIDVYVQGLFTTDWTKAGSVITFPYTLSGDTVEVQFRILSAGTAYRQTFTGITGYTLTLTNPLPTQLAAIKLHVNGVLSTEFARTNSTTITMNYELYPSDSVTVTYYT